MHSDPDVLALMALEDPSASYDGTTARNPPGREPLPEQAAPHEPSVNEAYGNAMIPHGTAGVASSRVGISERDRAHVASCAMCASDVRSLRRVTELARSAGPDAARGEPGPAVWSAIRAELHLPSDSRAPQQPGRATGERDERTDAAPRSPRPRRSPPGRRRIVAIVAASLVAVASVTAVVALVASVLGTGPGSVVAETRLTALPTWTGSAGTATVERLGDGQRELVVQLETPASADHPVAVGHREVWLLSADTTALVSLGVIDGVEGRFALPADVDLAEYPIVDVSEEPDDGDPAHSGDSIVRGTLPV